METLGAFIVEAGKCLTNSVTIRVATLQNFKKNIQTLTEELQKLIRRKGDIIDDIDIAKLEGKHPPREVTEWLQKVETIEQKVEEIVHEARPLLEADTIDTSTGQGCIIDSNMRRKYHLSKTAAKKCDEVKQLMKESCKLPPMEDTKLSGIRVEHIPAPCLVGQKAPEMLRQLMEFLVNEGITKIAVYGMGGSGKTTLAKTLNNQLESSATEFFDMVIWIPVSYHLDIRKVQSRIAERLNLALSPEESTDRRACKLHRVLKSGKRFRLILDDVWEKIDLDIVGIPQGGDQTNCKIVLTTRSLSVCREMMTDKDLKMELLNDEEAWSLFAHNAGNVVELEDINPLARDIVRACGCLPLAIEAMGEFMRDKTIIHLWKNALWKLKHSAQHYGSIDKVYLRLKLSYNSLPSKIYKWCFLYCSLYPENFLINTRELIYCWIADGLIGEHQTLEECFNDGITKLEYLKDSSMLQQGEGIDTVKMHSVLRLVAIWISSNEKESGAFSCSFRGMQEKMKRVSFVNKSITSLPTRFPGGSSLTVLFLQCNPLNKIPDSFFREVRALKFLNLSCTEITSLPSSLVQLRELHTLLLRNCHSLENLPPLGALYKLQVLDLYGTRIRELPKDMGMLIHLRDLNLSHTCHLDIIIDGSISGLSSLEVLDMFFSAYKWDVARNGKRAAVEELLSLRRLSVLHIRLDTADCSGLDSAGPWFERLKEYTIWITPRSCNSTYLPTQQHEKRVILTGLNFWPRGLEGILCTASSLDLITCGFLSSLSDIVANKNLGGMPNLKSLMISNCDCISTSLLIGEETQRSTLPNLEHLSLNHLDNLETMLDTVVPRGCLGNLKTIKAVGCGRLKNLISFALLRMVQNLEEIKVSECRRMKQIIAKINFYETLPKLKIIELRDMEVLRSICSRATEWSTLERIEVSNCPELKKLPFSARDALTIKEIKGELNWWNNLSWVDDGDMISLQQRFQACADTTVLATEDA